MKTNWRECLDVLARKPLRTALALALAVSAGRAQNTCPVPGAADFRRVNLVGNGQLTDPIHLAVAHDGRVFVAESKTATIKVYKPGANPAVSVAGKLAARTSGEGILGIALHPQFEQNRWLFAFYTSQDAGKPGQILSRFTVEGDRFGDATRRDLLFIPRLPSGGSHSGGGMAFDDKGVLVIGTGDDTNPHGAPNDGYGALYWKELGKDAQKSSANSNDLRGKVLRIRPEADGSYSIPQGNLWETLQPALTAADLAKVRKEIYAMGFRNPHRVSVDSKTGWIFAGEVGPDARSDRSNRGRAGHDELNVITEPGFFGWPYCNGNNFAYNAMDYSGSTGVIGDKFDCSKPVNASPNNTGIRNLPPSRPPVLWYANNNNTDHPVMSGGGGQVGMAGPMYRYDRNLNSKVKFPPYMDGKVYFYDWARNVHVMVDLDARGGLKSAVKFRDSANTLKSNISAQYGPDGALYMLQYSDCGYCGGANGLFRLEYKGAYDETCLPVSVARTVSRKAGSLLVSGTFGRAAFELPETAVGAEVFTLQGRKIWGYRRTGSGKGPVRLLLPEGWQGQVMQVRFSYGI